MNNAVRNIGNASVLITSEGYNDALNAEDAAFDAARAAKLKARIAAHRARLAAVRAEADAAGFEGFAVVIIG